MRKVFADACYWIALMSTKDRLHETARRFSENLQEYRIVTSEMILVEVLNGVGNRGPSFRKKAMDILRALMSDPNIEIIPQTSLQFRTALTRYESALDKDWGLTDCASFDIMHEKGLTETLTQPLRYFVWVGGRMSGRWNWSFPPIK